LVEEHKNEFTVFKIIHERLVLITFATSPFNWGWDKEKPSKVVSVLTFTMPILNNVVIDCFIFLNGVHVELFTPPPKLLGVISSSGLITI
jgi:hypothetical protein